MKKISKKKSENVYVPFGQWLRDQRERAGLSQTEIADLFGFHSQFISNWERGFSAPPVEYWKRLCSLYGVDPEELLRVYMNMTKRHLYKVLGIRRV